MPTLPALPLERSLPLVAEYLQMAELVQPTIDGQQHDSSVEISNRGLRVGHAAARIGRAIGVSMLLAGVYGAHSAYDNLHDDRTIAIERVQALDLRAVDTELNASLSTGRMPDTAPLVTAVNQAMPGITADIQTAQKDTNQLSDSLEVAGLGLLVGGLSSEEALHLVLRPRQLRCPQLQQPQPQRQARRATIPLRQRQPRQNRQISRSLPLKTLVIRKVLPGSGYCYFYW